MYISCRFCDKLSGIHDKTNKIKIVDIIMNSYIEQTMLTPVTVAPIPNYFT